MDETPNVPALRLDGVRKAFAGHVAVHGLSLDVPRGSVFGLLGPNGAGKTTTLRMVMRVLLPDAGTVEVLGRAGRSALDDVGYLPEERGLYPRMVVEEQLLLFATLKGLSRAQAARRVGPWLERLGLLAWRRRRLNELSKGMQQKAQLVATLLHDPEILILDEPMSGLDPLAADEVREVLLEWRARGRTVVLSSHQMETVERLCDAIALMNQGRLLLGGPVSEVKRRYGHSAVALSYEGDGSFLLGLPGVERMRDFGRYVELRLTDGADAQALLREAAARLRVSRFELVEPSLHDIFVEAVKAGGQEAAA